MKQLTAAAAWKLLARLWYAPNPDTRPYTHSGLCLSVDTLPRTSYDVRHYMRQQLRSANPAGSGWWWENSMYNERQERTERAMLAEFLAYDAEHDPAARAAYETGLKTGGFIYGA